ncbi:MAG TPA: sensor histidine kinase, partial [Chitinophagaceae bacterium]|nr:sensor histidine kinase [Chitinophagaceae bacterium]
VDESKEGHELNVFLHLIQGVVKRRQSNYEAAYQSLLQADSIANAAKDDTLRYSTLTQLGIISVTMKDLDRAMSYHKNAIEMARRMHNPRKMAKSCGNIGVIYREKSQFKEGIQYNEEALKYANESGDSSSIAFALAELGTMYDRSGQYEKATPLLMQALALRERLNEQNELAYTYFYIGNNMRRKGQEAQSIQWIRKGYDQAVRIENVKQIIDAYHSMFLNFEECKRYDSANIYLRKFVDIRDSLSGKEVKEKIEELNIKYETQKKDLKIKDAQLKNTYLLAGVGILLLGLGLLYVAYHRRKLIFKNQLQESLIQEQNKATKAIIEAEENERQRIAADLHDGVGQTITAAKMNLQALHDKLTFTDPHDQHVYENALLLVSNSAGEVRTISHQMMPNALLKNGLGQAVRNFLDSLHQPKLKVQLFTDGLQQAIDSNIEIFLYRIIQECVNNVLKHAYASELNISILVNASEVDVTIEDNGVGFDTTKLSDKAGIGISNMQKRIQFLKGDIHWDSQEGKGTTVVLNVPM